MANKKPPIGIAIMVAIAFVLFMVYDGVKGEKGAPRREKIIKEFIVQLSSNMMELYNYTQTYRNKIAGENEDFDVKEFEESIPESVEIRYKNVRNLQKKMMLYFKINRLNKIEFKGFAKQLTEKNLTS